MPLLAPTFDQAVDLRADIDALIVSAIVDDPRSQQLLLGPSEMGCPRCIARHYLGHAKLVLPADVTPLDVPWLPWIGTAMHVQLECVLQADNERLTALGLPERWETEKRVPVGEIANRYHSGSTDFFDLWTLTVGDWKLVGKTKLDKVRRHRHPGGIYQKQAHIYGRGRVLLGYDVANVAIYFLPRNEISMSKGVWWTEPYNEALALEAIANVRKIADVAQQVRGDLEAEIKLLEKLQKDDDCFSCDDYPPLPGLTGQTSKDGRAQHPDFEQPASFTGR